jgi:hypothetical protein
MSLFWKDIFVSFFALMANMHSHTVSERIDNVKMAYFRKFQTVQLKETMRMTAAGLCLEPQMA